MENNLRINAWVVSAPEKALFDQIFESLDIDNDGFIIGTDDCVKKIFLKTGLVHTVLAHIWNLCDIKQNGKLNSEQFALAMYFVNEVKKGNELPTTLTPELIPPTLRPKPCSGLEQNFFNLNIQSNVNQIANEMNKFSNKELDLLAEELRELENEKSNIDHEVTQQETHIKLMKSEIKNIQNEIETMLQMIKQLENQKIEANKRLDEMNIQVTTLNSQNDELKKRYEIEEEEFLVKKKEFENLESEEQKFETQLIALKNEIQKISSEIADSQLLICKYKTQNVELEEYENHLEEENNDFEISLSSKDIHRLNSLITKQLQPPEGFNIIKQNNNDAFNETNDFPSLSQEFSHDPFAGEDPFASEGAVLNEDDFFSDEAFANAFGKSSIDFPKTNEDFNDPFSSKQNFNLEDTIPELPPKKSKGPPPRPAPPKQSKPLAKNLPPSSQQDDPWSSTPVDNSDPFSSSSNSFSKSNTAFDNFADFANFDKIFFTSSVDPAGKTKNTQTNKLNKLNPNLNCAKQFDDFFSSSNWSKSNESSSNYSNELNLIDSGPIYNFIEDEQEKLQREKQIKDDYDLAIRLHQSYFNNNPK